MNYTVKFLPDDKTIIVPSETTIGEAARCAELTTLHFPCGGKGTCGKCIVGLSSGNGGSIRQVQACTTAVISDCTVTLPEPPCHSAASLVTDAAIDRLDSASPDFSPLCCRVTVTVKQPSTGACSCYLQRLEQAMDKGKLHCCRAPLVTLASALRANGGTVTAVYTDATPAADLIALFPGNPAMPFFGIACDIGTTTIAVRLVNCDDGSIAATAADYNGQISRGADIISRIDYARTPEKLAELRGLVLATVNRLIADVCRSAAVPADAIYAMVVAGNCTMTHFALGLPPQHVREAPYVPTVNHVPMLRAADCSFHIHPEAPVLFAPGVGSYVGGDIVAGLLCTDMIEAKDTIALFIDIGTNGEIVIGNGEFLLACACSAGPAFEGSGVACGMRADKGAIDSFIIDATVDSIDYTVVDNDVPRGICGSGLISLLGELLAAGYIDRSGKINETAPSSRRIQINGTSGLVLVEASSTAHGRDIIITEADIDNLIRTKGAIYAACDLMLRNAGLDFTAIDRVLIAGGFGKYIDLEAAIRIGFFPDIRRNRFSYLGNTSLGGATRALLSGRYRRELDNLQKRITYVDLSIEAGYMDAYVAALFLPHTDLARFPSARR